MFHAHIISTLSDDDSSSSCSFYCFEFSRSRRQHGEKQCKQKEVLWTTDSKQTTTIDTWNWKNLPRIGQNDFFTALWRLFAHLHGHQITDIGQHCFQVCHDCSLLLLLLLSRM